MTGDPLGRPYLPALDGARAVGEAPRRIRVSSPPFPCAGEGGLRVIGVRATAGGPEWILGYTAYRRLPRHEAGR